MGVEDVGLPVAVFNHDLGNFEGAPGIRPIEWGDQALVATEQFLASDSQRRTVEHLEIDKRIEEVAEILVDVAENIGVIGSRYLGVETFDLEADAIADLPVAVQPHPREQEVVGGRIKTGGPCLLAHATFMMIAQS